MKPRFVMLTAALLALAGAREAQAFERQHHLGFGGGFSLLKAENTSLAPGGGGAIHYSYGLSDSLNLLVEGGTSVLSIPAPEGFAGASGSRTLLLSSLGAGIGYSFDVVQWVPYVGILGSGYLAYGPASDGAVGAAGVQAALGIDYQVSRSFSVGLALRQHVLLSKITTYPSYTTAFLRAEYVWGW
ncbi:hypothetical protein LVJ94_41095 [Pendulispora rubella]|uniref:Outer membrane protein beta-barrel domain-containing protein n=1 Tax=Pendulispora rubella TaxID=2741070 RepID=A0ABZ2KXF8_9BACT